MHRLPILACVSRETNRLPARVINSTLGCKGKGLPFDQLPHLGTARPSQYAVYYIGAHEFPNNMVVYHDQFVLVEVNGSQETILDQGEAHGGIRHHLMEIRYADFAVKGKKLGNFKFYVPLTPELVQRA